MTALLKRHTVLLLLVVAFNGWAQKASEADRLFFEYDYAGAVTAYEALRRSGELTPQQRLNLAESYFRRKAYDKSSEAYLESFRQDSLMDNHHFNTMLQALAKTSGQDRVQAFLSTRATSLSGELLENAAFNYELLEKGGDASLDYRIFPLSVNSGQMDLSPAFYGEDRLLFSSARPHKNKETYKPTGQAFMDIYVAVVDPDGQTRGAQPIGWLENTKYHESTPFFSPLLNGIFYVRSNEENGELTYDENGKNALAVALGTRDGDDRLLLRDPGTSFYYPFFDDATERLYFAADFDQGYGGTDLYYVATNEGRIMSSPVNLGPRINTPGNEIAPFLMDGSLFFASDVFYGLGGMDVYKAEEQEDGVYSIPVNLGPELNTPHDEFGFIIRPGGAGYQGYFTSNRPGGTGSDDLYGFAVNSKPGLKTLVVRGTVVDGSSAEGIDKARIRMVDASGATIKEAYTLADGSFFMEIPWRDNVRVLVDKERHTSAVLGPFGTANTEDTTKAVEVTLTPVSSFVRDREGHHELKAERFFFDKGSAQLTAEIASLLNPAAEALKQFPSMQIRIEAHTDSRGSTQANLALSQRRALAIRDYLLSQGVAADQITSAEGLGESQIINNCTDGVYCLEVLHRQNERYPLIVENFENL
ncbi:OmpA family protein [Robiginitalea sediminis]|uniref:OmpA family protein n=1 Tax=Robiginitalea sediminis TaxID=1982593 RepID=UPI000B4AC9F7|nr:OmpA family protein [Robiginitalea sediminis]